MILKKLHIKNYKSVKELLIDDFQQINLFIGKNDAGKSNVVNALDILFNGTIKNYNNSLELIEENSLRSIFAGASKFQFYDKKSQEAEITAYISLSQHEIDKLELGMNEADYELVISKKIKSSKDQTIIELEFIRLNKNVLIKTSDEKKRFLTKDKSYSSNEKDFIGYKLIEVLGNEFIMMPAERNIVRDPHPLSQKLRVETYLKSSLINLGNSDDEDKKILFKQFSNFISEISPLIEKVHPIIENKKIVDLEFKTSRSENIPLSTIGGGNNELLLLLHEIIISGGKMLAIEEPEIHLHPEAQRKLNRFIEEFSQTTQIFLVTHSTVFVKPNNLRGLFRVVKDEDTKIFSMDTRDYIDRDRLEQELNAENCEMFFADKVLLVEGISDKIMMDGLIEKYCKSTEEIKVVTAYSKDNFEVYVRLLKIFAIPYKILTDLDSIKGRFKAKVVWNEVKGKEKMDRYQMIEFLKKKNIHVLSKGALEQSYPRKYRRGETKPLDALYALHNITDEEYNSDMMKDLRNLIEALEK
jgi:predicted ATP-dependent endonuclease of OLD family